MVGRPVVALLLCILVSGCCSAPFSARDIGGAPDEGGVGDRRVTVTVLEDGELARDAGVALFWLRDGPIREEDERVAVHVLRLRGPGTVTAWVPTNRDVAVAAATGEGFTEEWVLDAAPAGSADEVVAVDLYPRHKDGAFDGTWAPAAATVPVAESVTGRAWNPSEVPFAADPERNAGFADRVMALRAELTWTNTQTATGDLGLTFGRDGDVAGTFNTRDDARETQPGTYNQSLDTRDGIFAPSGGGPLLLGPSTQGVVLAPTGLDYRVTYEVELRLDPLLEEFCDRLDGRNVDVYFVDPETGEARRAGQDAPGPGLFAFAPLLGFAWFLRRPRQP